MNISRKSDSRSTLTIYFLSLFLDMFIVAALALLVLSLLGIPNAFIIAISAGLLNIIPYIGPVIAVVIALFLSLSSCISAGEYHLFLPVASKVFFSLITINTLDGFVIQPILFSATVKAHPLEVFIVTLMAGTVAGIPGMVLALPAYTLLRIIAREFFSHLNFFRKLSGTP
jgi:predicted PurR-regulated permease PerM